MEFNHLGGDGHEGSCVSLLEDAEELASLHNLLNETDQYFLFRNQNNQYKRVDVTETTEAAEYASHEGSEVHGVVTKTAGQQFDLNTAMAKATDDIPVIDFTCAADYQLCCGEEEKEVCVEICKILESRDVRDSEERKVKEAHVSKNDTMNNCVTDWEVDDTRNKVWSSLENCTPLTWVECTIEDKEVDSEVAQLDQICEVQTDKASVTITSSFDGVVTKVPYEVDDIAQSGDPLVDVEVKKVEKEETFDAREWKEQVDVGSKPGRSKDLATPAVSRIGMEHNVKLVDVTGTGKVTCTDFNADSGDDGVPVVESIARDQTATVSKLYTLESSGEEIFRMDIAMSPPPIVSASLTGPGVGISAGGSVPGTSNSCVRNKNSKDMEKEKNEMTKEELQYIDEKMKMSFGGEMSEYQKIRKNNIVERVVKMREALADIQQLKRKIFEENEAGKKRKGTDEAKPAKKIKVDNFEHRRSNRPKKPANYFPKEDDPDWEPPSKRKKDKKRKRDPFDDDPDWETPSKKKKNIIWDPSKERKALSPGQPSSEESRGISIRTEKEANYASTEPREDDFVFCQTCKKLMYHGCEEHPFIFDYDAQLEIGPSKAGRNAGRGVFNVDRQRSIPENVMFGPYDGDFYTVEEYNILIKEGGESGYAWELRSEDNMDNIVGYFDPGSNPNPKEAWMPMVNMATKDRHQNVVAIQFHGKIYYKTLCAISYGQEILVDYGASYGKEMGIKIEEKSLYELKENWTKEGIPCTHCGKLFVNEKALLDHLNPARKGRDRVAGCTVLLLERNSEEVMNGILSHVCEQCGRGFKHLSRLETHKLVHTNEKRFSCPDCGKLYKSNGGLNVHIKIKHSEDPETFPCSWCKKEFLTKSGLKVHWKTVCDREEPHLKCAECGMEFKRNSALNEHVKAVHRREFGVKCDECGKRFVRQSALNSHIKTVHSSERPFKCDDCEASFKTAHALDHHRIRKHTKQYYWNCDVCEEEDNVERGFLVPKELKAHMVAKHPIEYAEQLKREKPFVCKKCPKRFSSQEEVATHDKKMHNV